MFEVTFTESALGDLGHLKKTQQNIVLDAIRDQLRNEPLVQTRNRKSLDPNDLSAWEMRVGSHRVFYDVDEANGVVTVKTVGWKEHNRLFIRGKAFEL